MNHTTKTVTLEVVIPDVTATERQIIEWLYFSFGYSAKLPMPNPLNEEGEPEVINCFIS